jgi:hypothetical protein
MQVWRKRVKSAEFARVFFATFSKKFNALQKVQR